MSRITGESVATNTIGLALAQLAGQLVTFFILPLFIKNLGAALYGVWATTTAISIVLGLLDLGFGQGVIRYLPRAESSGDPREVSRVLATGSAMLCIAGVAAAAIMIFGRSVIADFFRVPAEHYDEATALLVVSGVATGVAWPLKIYGLILQAHFKLKEQRTALLVVQTTESLVMLALLLAGLGVVQIRIGTAVSTSLLTLLLFRRAAKRVMPSPPIRPWRAHLKTLREMSGFTSGVFLARLLQTVAQRVDTMIVARILGVTDVPFYVASSKLWQVTTQYTRVLGGAFMPAVYNLHAEGDGKRVESLVVRSGRYHTVTILPVCLLGAILAPYFIPLWLGPAFQRSVVWAQIFLLAPPTASFRLIGDSALAYGLHFQRVLLLAGGTVLNVALSLTLAPHVGIGGPILGTVFSSWLLSEFTSAPYFARRMGIRVGAVYREFLLCLLVTAPVAFGLSFVLRWVAPSSWGILILCAAGGGGLLVLTAAATLFGKPERQLALKLLGAGRLPDPIVRWLER